MRQVIKHRDIRLLNMIRRTDPEIPMNEDDLKRMLDRPEIQQMIDIKNILK